jgi:transposase InsO family protein
VDDCTRECVAIEVDTSITGMRVKAIMERLADTRGLPRSIIVDHGPEFEGQVLDAWAYTTGVQLAFIRPGKRGLTLTAARERVDELRSRYLRGDRDLRAVLDAEQHEAERQRREAEEAEAARPVPTRLLWARCSMPTSRA